MDLPHNDECIQVPIAGRLKTPVFISTVPTTADAWIL
jgi:hypothetical protein